MKIQLATAAVALRTAIRYSKNWNKNSPTVRLLQSMMPDVPGQKKGYRYYIDLKRDNKHYSIPPAVRSAVKNAGFVITDYLAKKCVKASDKEQKNVFNIGKVIAKDPHAKAAFDNDPQLQNSKTSEIKIVVSCHPYDIIGMSTGRDWDKQSCMRLDDGYRNVGDAGAYHRHVEHDVAEGTLVAYAIRASDTNIQKPLGRCLIKPFLNSDGYEEGGEHHILFRRETAIYGNGVPGFGRALNLFLHKLNAKVPSGYYERVQSLYDDGVGDDHHHDADRAQSDKIAVSDVVEDNRLIIPYMDQIFEEDASVREALAPLRMKGLELHDTEVTHLAGMFREDDEVKDELDYLIRSGQATTAIYKLAKALDLTHKNQPSNYRDMSRNELVGQATLKDEKAMVEILNRLNNEETSKSDADMIYTSWCKSRLPLPSADLLLKYPKVTVKLASLAKASMNLRAFFDDGDFDEFAFAFRDLNVDPASYGDHRPEPEDLLNMMYAIGHYELALCCIYEEYKWLGVVIYDTVNHDYADRFDNRKLYRAFSKLSDSNMDDYMDRIREKIFERIMAGSRLQFKDAKPDVLAQYLNDPDLLRNKDRWEPTHIHRLIDFSLPLAMMLDIPNDSLLPRVLPEYYKALVAYEGEPLEVQSVSMEWAMQLLVYANKLTKEKPDIASKIAEFEPLDTATLIEKYRVRNAKTYNYEKTLAAFCLSLKIGQAVDGERLSVMDDPVYMATDFDTAVITAPPHKLAENIHTILNNLIERSDIRQIVRMLETVSESLNYQPDFTSPDDYANDKMEEEVVDDFDYHIVREQYEEEGRDRLETELAAFRKVAEAHETLREFVGYDDSEETLDVDLPNVSKEDLDQAGGDISMLIQTVNGNQYSIDDSIIEAEGML
ncbi:hypothetical protein LU11_gp214 [Pseudomonas phage Lu11]|uniref:hypothetical protein n=1 Tax=Pseudomonas phage Lu11 TaxID=1161927 RepID=UPI00025F17FC|nr:hypothetical protein LU11_gp214 [Pseudomonas phage Lu11]AFH14745.1 hypothetical protein Lu11_0208 [Pseudomonas phage Lu11]